MTLRSNFDFQQRLHRRTLLKGVGISMAMPWLSAMDPAFGASTKQVPKRFVAMTLGLGLLADNLNPSQTGREYKPSAYLKDFHDLKNDFTVISGTSHPGVGGGHRAESSFCLLHQCQQEYLPVIQFQLIVWRNTLATKHDFHSFWRCPGVIARHTPRTEQ